MRLIVDKLAKTYGFLWALKDLSLDLVPGELVALLGPNGAGKTTLLKLLAGLTAPTAGSIGFDGVDVSGGNPVVRGKVGLFIPGEHLYDNLTVEENLVFFLSLYGREKGTRPIHPILEEAGLGDRRKDYVGNLSSGLKCRLSIAKWQLLDPGLLLLDEPYGVLDGAGVDLLENFLKAHCVRGNIAVMASHHVSRALNLCSRALVLHRGRLTFNEAKRHPWPSFERAFAEFLPQGESWRS